MRSRPCAQLLVLGMTSIPQHFKQMFIATNATAILWRARACSIQTARRKAIRSPRFNLFYRNHMLPTIPKIVFIDKAGPLLTSNLLESNTSIILHSVIILWIWLPIVGITDDELMKMIILPPHNDLEHPVQTKERHLTRNYHASPDRWFNISKTNIQLIDNVICDLSHRCDLLLQLISPIHPIMPIFNSLLRLLIHNNFHVDPLFTFLI